MTDPINHIDFIRSAQAGVPAQGTSRPHQTAEMSPEQQETLQLRKTCREFESVFVAYLLKEMRATVDKSGLVDGGQSEQLYQRMKQSRLHVYVHSHLYFLENVGPLNRLRSESEEYLKNKRLQMLHDH